MVLINKAINEVTVKLVYYGPGLCGKTTNLEKIYGNPKLENKGKMISMSTETDRTLFFDFMPMELGTIAGQKVRVQLYTVPGQVFYDATRKLVLRGADGVVFVADSQESMKESNLDSLANLKTNLRINRLDPDKVAVVYQLNKRDLPNVSSVEDMKAYLNVGDAPVVEASAITGHGVTATLRAAVAKILDNVKNHVDTTLYEEPPLAAPDMTQKAGVAHHSAGTPKLTMKSEAAPFDTGDVAVQVEEDPFAEPEHIEHIEFEDPFAAPVAVEQKDSELEELLANARAIVASLETALERARENERRLAARLGVR
jgi:signal recognition particle receptor subunit beta